MDVGRRRLHHKFLSSLKPIDKELDSEELGGFDSALGAYVKMGILILAESDRRRCKETYSRFLQVGFINHCHDSSWVRFEQDILRNYQHMSVRSRPTRTCSVV